MIKASQISLFAIVLMSCGDGMSETSANGYEILIHESLNEGCGLAETQSLLIENANALEELRALRDPNIRVADYRAALTMDFRAARQTIIVNDDKKTIEMKCG